MTISDDDDVETNTVRRLLKGYLEKHFYFFFIVKTEHVEKVKKKTLGKCD